MTTELVKAQSRIRLAHEMCLGTVSSHAAMAVLREMERLQARVLELENQLNVGRCHS